MNEVQELLLIGGTILLFGAVILGLEWFDKDSKAPWKIWLVKWLDGRRK